MLTADRLTKYREGIEVEYPVKAATEIFSGAMVCVDATGYAVPAGDIAQHKFVGVSRQWVNNTGANGALSVLVRRRGIFEFAASSIAMADVGKNMYVVEDDTFDESDPGQGIICGRLYKFVSATKGWISIDEATFVQALPGSADALLVSDAGDHFPAATDTVAEQIQALAGALIPITVPRYTGWVKDGADKQLVGPKIELNYPCRIKRAYMNLGTASQAGGGEVLEVLFGATSMLTPATAATQAENEALDIPVAADTDLLTAAGGVLLNETAGGLAANLDLILMVARDDGV